MHQPSAVHIAFTTSRHDTSVKFRAELASQSCMLHKPEKVGGDPLPPGPRGGGPLGGGGGGGGFALVRMGQGCSKVDPITQQAWGCIWHEKEWRV